MLEVILNKTLKKKNIDNFSTLENQSLNMDKPENYYSEYEKTSDLIKDRYETKNNFVNAFLHAYNHHKTLRLRPDDIKLQFLMIVSTFVNNNAEMMRPFFVDHEGKKELTVVVDAFKPDQIFGEFGRQLEENIKCPEFAKHYTHKFSTTTQLISVVNNLTLMNTLKEYFAFTMTCMCGIPSVILEGTQEDWKQLKQTYQYFKGIMKNYELKEWYNHFDIIMDMFIEMRMLQEIGAVVAPEHIVKQWERVISYIPVGSGGEIELAGWVRLFCPYSCDKKIIDGLDKPLECFNTSSKFDMFSKLFKPKTQKLEYWYTHGVDWNILPSSIISTPATVDYRNGGGVMKSYKIDIHSGFFAPHYNRENDTIEMNIGFMIKENEEERCSKTRKNYEEKGVYINHATIMIPKNLRKETDIIGEYFGKTDPTVWFEKKYYGIDEEQEKARDYYLSNGVIVEKVGEYSIIHILKIPKKFEDEINKIMDAFDIGIYTPHKIVYIDS